jgi:hypothetical protein
MGLGICLLSKLSFSEYDDWRDLDTGIADGQRDRKTRRNEDREIKKNRLGDGVLGRKGPIRNRKKPIQG